MCTGLCGKGAGAERDIMISCEFRRIHLLGIGFGLFVIGCSMFPQLAARHDPLTETDRLKVGMVYEENGEWERALAEYKAVLQENQQHLHALINTGNVYAQLRQYQEAEEYYRKALLLDPNHPMANNNLAWILTVEGVHLAEAEALIGMAMSSDPNRWSVYFDTLAYLYLRQGRFSEAMSSIGEAEEHLSPGDDILKAQLASMREFINRVMESGVNPPSSMPAAVYQSEETLHDEIPGSP
jgi:Tfp pilus assembly protein PilF